MGVWGSLVSEARPLFSDPLASTIFAGIGRKGAFIWKCLLWSLLVLLDSASVGAQSTAKLEGRVYDAENGGPVAQARIQLQDTDFQEVCDNFGSFSVDNLPPGVYRLKVTAIGFTAYVGDPVHIVEDVTRQVSVPLERKTYQVDGITVTGRREPLSSDRVRVLEREQIETLHARSVSEALESVPGVIVEKSGGASGRSQVRIRGADPKHVLVLIDGQKANPSGNGVADLNTLPIEMVERIEIHKGGASAEFGPDALGGVINIITLQRAVTDKLLLQTDVRRGRWNSLTRRISATNLIGWDDLSTRLAYSASRADNDFDFRYTVAPQNEVYEGTRINNSTDSYNYFGSGIYRLSSLSRLKVSGQVFRKRNGLPDRASDQNARAFVEDRRKHLTALFELEQSEASRWEAQVGFSRFEQYYWDLAARSFAERFESQHTNDIFTVQAANYSHLWPGNEIHTGLQLSRDILYHADYFRPQLSMGKATRDDYAGFVIGKQRFVLPDPLFFDEAALDFAWRYDRAETEKDSTSWQDPGPSHAVGQWSPKVGVAVSKGGRVSIILRASYGKSFRLPSINALFWKGDARSRGNPNLRPERSEHSEIGLEVSGSKGIIGFSGGVTYFHSFVSDIVVWQEGYGGVWQPVNLAAARINGHEDQIKLTFFDHVLELTYQNTVTTPLNRGPGPNSYNKQLTFAPHYVTNLKAGLNIDLHYYSFFAAYAVRLVDKRYALPSNTKWYDAYRVDDIDLGFGADLADRWRISGDIKVYNWRDQDYTLLTHYPMPGREWDVGLQVLFGADPGRTR